MLTEKAALEPVSFFVNQMNRVIRYKILSAVFCTHSQVLKINNYLHLRGEEKIIIETLCG